MFAYLFSLITVFQSQRIYTPIYRWSHVDDQTVSIRFRLTLKQFNLMVIVEGLTYEIGLMDAPTSMLGTNIGVTHYKSGISIRKSPT